jgi:hypothetical protein
MTTLGDIYHRIKDHLRHNPEDYPLPVVLARDSEGNEARTLADVSFGDWFQPLEEQPAIGDLPADADADPALCRRVCALWPTV